MSADGWDRKRTVRLTTRGRKSGKQRTVTVWFVPAGPRSVFVQHASRQKAQWYANLSRDPAVTLDFGSGPVSCSAKPIEDPERVRAVLEMVRRKYWTAWLIQLIGRGAQPVAAEIAFG